MYIGKKQEAIESLMFLRGKTAEGVQHELTEIEVSADFII